MREQERRSQPRRPPDKYYSVQFKDPDAARIFQFKLWDVSDLGLCIVVPDTSAVLDRLQVGQTLAMSYYLSAALGTTEPFRTEIRHITPQTEGRFKGHHLVGLLIKEA